MQLLELPNELLVHIIRHLTQRDIFFGVARANRRLRHIVHANLKSLPLFDAHCHVHIVDQLPASDYRQNGTDPIITYTFTVFDIGRSDFKQKKRLCLRGNDDTLRDLHLTHLHDGSMQAQFSNCFEYVDENVVRAILSYTCLTACRFQVRKSCRRESTRLEDDFFADCLAFFDRVCTRLSIDSLLLCSKNVLFPWQLGKRSLHQLSQLDCLRSLILENMTTFDAFQAAPPLIPISQLCSLQFRLDQRHRMDIEQMTLSQIDGSILKALSEASVAHLDFSAYSDVSSFISSIDAVHMCYFVSAWRSSSKPWMIRSISFNSLVSIDEFRSMVYRIMPREEIVDIPYCRFRTHHKIVSDVILELACYANGNATQWLLRTGYKEPKEQTQN